MQNARRFSLGFGEVGGWAVSENHRWTPESLRIVLATYGLLELLGSCAGVATATFRHHSATILQRIGLSTLRSDGEEIKPYYDPQYGCLMQILQFDSRSPNAKYRGWISELMSELAVAPVICRESRLPVFERMWREIEAPEFARQSTAISVGV
jgi:hypothetical protein